MTTTEGNSPDIDTNQQEYIQYTMAMDQAITQLVDGLHNSDDPEEILQEMLVAVTEFYDGDWAGIMEADLTMKIWSTYWWYNRNTGGMTPNRFADLEDGEYMWRWIDAMTQGTPMIIEDIESIRRISPIEYCFLKANSVKSMIAVPFWKRPTGFLIVRNPKRYLSRTSVLKALAFVAVSSINEKRLLDNMRMTQTPDFIKHDNDIVINLCDGLSIITNKGVLTEDDLKSPKMTQLITYLLLRGSIPAPPLEIFQRLWPEEDDERANTNVKVLVYRLQQMFGLISDYRLVEYARSGYRLNPELNIVTDLQMFEEYWDQAQITADLSTKGDLLKKAIETYKHGPLPHYAGEAWLIASVSRYNLRYIAATNLLLTTLEQLNDYVCIYEYASMAVRTVPQSEDAHYWLVKAMQRICPPELAHNQLRAARQLLTAEAYHNLLQRLDLDNPR